ncbi:MAG: hypothetical protein KME22_09510 [Hassallia sp. WJT32-NPBG1]|nr:hypothetical protein [Hassallia sp. WJT32-NPBG1]
MSAWQWHGKSILANQLENLRRNSVSLNSLLGAEVGEDVASKTKLEV